MTQPISGSGKTLPGGPTPTTPRPAKRRRTQVTEETRCWPGIADEVVMQILGQLRNPKDLMSSTQACRHLRRVGKDDILWNHLGFSDFQSYHQSRTEEGGRLARLHFMLLQGNYTKCDPLTFTKESPTSTEITTFTHDDKGWLYVGLCRETYRVKSKALAIMDLETKTPMAEIHCVTNDESQKYTADLQSIGALVDIGEGRVAVGSGDGKILIYDLRNKEESLKAQLLRTKQEKGNDITSLACDKNEQKLFVGFWGGKTEIWDLKTEKCEYTFQDEESLMNSTVVYADQKLYYFSNQIMSNNKCQAKIKVFDLKIGRGSLIDFQEPSGVAVRSFATGDNKCFSAWKDGKIRILDLRTGALSILEMPEGKSISSLAFGVKGFLFVGLDNGEVMIWNYLEESPKGIVLSGLDFEQTQLYGRVSSLNFNYEEKKLYAAFEKGMVIVWSF